MDLNDYLSMTWFLLPCFNICCFSLCLFLPFFPCNFSLDGKRESTATGALSTSTTVRPHFFLNSSPLNRLLTSVNSLSSPHVRRIDECALLYLCPDTKNTQWEDPRLQSPAITGPVSSFCCYRPGGLSATSSSVPVRHDPNRFVAAT